MDRPLSRVLIYSHDSYGLGHLRRCRAIAHALVAENPTLSVLILSGSALIGSFDFPARVDFVRIPGVIKLRNGEYTSQSLQIDIDHTQAMRAGIIKHTADMFDPDFFLVDKEPLGLRGEVGETLELLKARGTPLALGLRDVMDDPALLASEWRRKKVLPALSDLYDEIWVYGLPQICDPLAELPLTDSIRRKVAYTGYLRRELRRGKAGGHDTPPFEGPYLLVTGGGGGDGDALVDWVLRAYESDASLPHPALVVFGPFMPPEVQAEFWRRIEALPMVEAVTFVADIERLIEGASGLVAMGGYNTFCEILSFDKPALIVPRVWPRREQLIRASRAQDLGLAAMLVDDGKRDPAMMATALRQLPQQRPPSDVVVPGLLDGLDNVNRLSKRLIATHRAPQMAVAQRS